MWNETYLEEKSLLRKYQEILISRSLNLQATIGKGDRDSDREEQVGKIWEVVRLAKHLAKNSLSWERLANEGVD